MDEQAKSAIAFAQRWLHDCTIVATKELSAGEIQFLVSGYMDPPDDPEDPEVATLFYGPPFEINIRVAAGEVTWHEWDQIDFD